MRSVRTIASVLPRESRGINGIAAEKTENEV